MKTLSIFGQIAAYFALAILAGCASATYMEPTAPAPELWQGASGYKYADDPWEAKSGQYTVGQAFAETKLENVRTGVLEEAVTFEDVSRMGYTSKSKTLVAGTPLYTRQYTRSVTTYYGGRPGITKTQSAFRNPIEWCAEGDNREDGDLTGWTCIFWQKADQAYYTSSSKGHPQSPELGSDGSLGVMPKIRETGDVSFVSDLKAGLVITALGKKDATVSLVFGGDINGKWDGNTVRFQRKDWDENDQVTFEMAGAEFTLDAMRSKRDSKPEAVKVAVIKAPTAKSVGSLTEEEKLMLLKILMDTAAKYKTEESKVH